MSSTLISVLILLVLVGFAFIKALPVYKEMRRMYQDTPQMDPKTALSMAQQWAIAAGANLASLNGNFLNTLPTGNTSSTAKTILKRDWGIETRQDAIEMIEWLQESGHSLYFEIIQDVLAAHPVANHVSALEEMQMRLEEAGHDRNLLTYYRNLQTGVNKLTEDGIITGSYTNHILSWDLGRVINLCRWCYDVKLFTEKEAWQYMMPAAERLQQSYTSWQDLSTGYLLGRVMWGGIREDYNLMIPWHRTLLKHPQSPWSRLSWQQPL